ncbi:hypothetical protein LXA47_31505 [Massilia sp. P8910]|uniref:hypothetical protein n=1 Tax=Massilia antarctica TaxID=2765360 RepID=UPI001E35FEC9|nr:hypothetical protein [Massilia antarctica]MCE3608098.1 hypothetical protein [Massilia antarctica]
MIVDFTFSIMIDSNLAESIINNIFLSSLDGASKSGGCIAYSDNILQLIPNTLHCKKDEIIESDDAWLYWRLDLNVFPIGNVTVDNQRKVAHQIISLLEKHGACAELVAEFEL